MATAKEIGMNILAEVADEIVISRADQLLKAGKAVWVFDPEVPGVVGLVKAVEGRLTNQALLVVYVDIRDFEESDDFWDLPEDLNL